MFRSFSEVLAELKRVENDAKQGNDYQKRVMAEAIAWGYQTARSSYAMEKRLTSEESLTVLVEEAAAVWDGQHSIGGAWSAAARMIREAAQAAVE